MESRGLSTLVTAVHTVSVSVQRHFAISTFASPRLHSHVLPASAGGRLAIGCFTLQKSVFVSAGVLIKTSQIKVVFFV